MSGINWASVRALAPSRADYAGLRASWRGDLLAGVTVGIVALPLALAFGVSSGAGAEAGLVTAIVAGLVAAVFGGSSVQVSGPTGAMVVVLAPIVSSHGVGAIAIVTVMAGGIVLLAGVLRLGRTVSYIPWPVIEGFTVGIGIIIFLQQVPSAVGVSGSGHSSNAVIAAIESVAEASWPQALLPIGIVVATGAIMGVLTRLNPRVPSSFVAIAVVTAVAVVSHLPLASIGALPHTLPSPAIPDLSVHNLSTLAAPAFTIAALAAIESLLSARVAASISDTGAYNADRELVGQGLASLASGFFGGMPATGAIARTAVNVRSGAKTRLSAIVHALALLAVVYLVADVVSRVPLATLSGVLMITAARMVSPSMVKRVLHSTRAAAFVFVLTAIITVSFDLITAVGIGIVVAAFFSLRALSKASGVRRQEIEGAAVPGDERIAVFRMQGALFFGAAERVVERVTEHHGIEVVVLRLSHLQIIDATGAHTLAELVTVLEQHGVTVLIKGVRPEHRALLDRLGVMSALRDPKHLFDNLPDAVAHAREHIARLAARQGVPPYVEDASDS